MRQKIINEALCWIEKENTISLSLRGVARRVGVSHSAPYRNFPDKKSLLIATAEIGLNQLHQTLSKALLNSSNDAQQKVQTLSIIYIQHAVKS